MKVPMVMVGNKCDMAKNNRAVSKEEGKILADEFNASFLEVSVSTTMFRQRCKINYQSLYLFRLKII